MAPADRDQSWVRELAARRGFALSDLSTSDHQHYRFDGDLGPEGGHRPWICSVHRAYLADGGAESWVEWMCPPLRAADPGRQLYAGFGGDGGGGGTSGDGAADLAVLGAGLAGALLRRRRRPPQQGEVTDVLALFDLEDPLGLISGPLRELLCHWPVVEAPPARWVRAVQRVTGVPQLPPDAPPRTLRIGMAVHAPLTVMTRDWWQQAAWLEHQIELGRAVARAVVAAGAHA